MMEVSADIHKENNFPIVHFWILPCLFVTRFHKQLRLENMDHINQGFNVHIAWVVWDLALRFTWRK